MFKNKDVKFYIDINAGDILAKKELLGIVNRHKTAEKIYVSYSYLVVCIPSYHCQYNPIEYVYGQLPKIITTAGI